MLTSVKRTEDSLLKLKRNRKSLVPSSPASGMSDDNKIRLQLALDIKEYSARVSKPLEVIIELVEPYVSVAVSPISCYIPYLTYIQNAPPPPLPPAGSFSLSMHVQQTLYYNNYCEHNCHLPQTIGVQVGGQY